MITDKIDGDIARKHNLVTNFGKIADPIADKALTGMAFVGLSIIGDIWWWVTIVVLLREWSVTLLRLSVLKHVVIAAADQRQAQDHVPGDRALRPDACRCRRRHSHGGRFDQFGAGEVLFYLAQGCSPIAVALTMWSGYEFFRDVWRQLVGAEVFDFVKRRDAGAKERFVSDRVSDAGDDRLVKERVANRAARAEPAQA